MKASRRITVVDSHTEGEPTRLVLDGGPALSAATVADAVHELRRDHDAFRKAVINEPRGSDILVGALLLPAGDKRNTAAVIFFNNAGYLGMCGHGAIGVAISLLREQRIEIGLHSFETPAGNVRVTIHDEHRVSVENVASYRYRKNVALAVEGIGTVAGDIAWGGNWFFLIHDHGLAVEPGNIRQLSEFATRVRRALDNSSLCGAGGAQIDHIELFGSPSNAERADSRNFVLCPGGAYDRSPCGTGTSAKIACLIEDGALDPGAIWRQESICGGLFTASAAIHEASVIPTITGSAFLTARSTLIFEPSDPFPCGLAEADERQ
ncbi:proline racemase family protein [Woeseia oceani]|uniref:Hydroxyproline-2-epimerase n=1 Tax=Woeseia oceani TaxID=1548547 RepID=A0A193LH07_9GAMM|nr:proline racemase family protein [Woeseia oceani]ANO51751.1 hydroxyproline-2-epimerase [Woeseia oceani]